MDVASTACRRHPIEGPDTRGNKETGVLRPSEKSPGHAGLGRGRRRAPPAAKSPIDNRKVLDVGSKEMWANEPAVLVVRAAMKQAPADYAAPYETREWNPGGCARAGAQPAEWSTRWPVHRRRPTGPRRDACPRRRRVRWRALPRRHSRRRRRHQAAAHVIPQRDRAGRSQSVRRFVQWQLRSALHRWNRPGSQH
jgi:hypothetical protein